MIGSGRNIAFWYEPWLGKDLVWELCVFEGTAVPLPSASVADMVDELGQWKWHLLERCLPLDILLRIAAVKPPAGLSIDDSPCWSHTPNGNIQVKSAYWSRMGIQSEPLEHVWKTIQDFKGLPRIKHFLWLLCHEKL
ncbi:hypothetical protein V6N11_047736 [Hibiscus sabdariffa]|uniref:Reverse transcriptase zinc-binding domain-containing protein n=1 Tax=Hibiscus sabdariffa TaxID=183260 RepID=A0ABR2P7U8_9ROSI